MSEVKGSLDSRFDWLRATQNPEGGWGFFPGKQSWLEPTVYALMALQGDPSSRENLERGWKLVRSWQLPDGSWQPCAAVRQAHWTTALCVTLHCVRNVRDGAFVKGVNWLLDTSGMENGLKFRLAHIVFPDTVSLDPSLKAWPWLPGNTSWIEPTAHALVALKKASGAQAGSRLRDRIVAGEKMILDRRCSDGGWNYGDRRVLGTDLPSYPETTALALLGLAGNRSLDVSSALAAAQRYLRDTRSPLAKAWLRVCLRSHGIAPEQPGAVPLAPNDTLINALEIIAATGVMA